MNTGWLIEWPVDTAGGLARWFTGATHCGWWGTANQAIRFARKEDAEAIVALLARLGHPLGSVIITEHSWHDPEDL